MFEPRFWLDLLQWVLMGCLAALMWARKPGESADKAVAEMRIDMTRLLERQAAQESVIVKMQMQQDKRIERLEDFFMAHFGTKK
ncbi:hypothetical protein [Limnohabitans sp.]|uniref:hypothetical protein n=1 Tax=Limnohabitans sp. TaxID=1907725 RepID=UPI00286F4C40|nr:hypothetical protein [Limnohabitans sp.]